MPFHALLNANRRTGFGKGGEFRDQANVRMVGTKSPKKRAARRIRRAALGAIFWLQRLVTNAQAEGDALGPEVGLFERVGRTDRAELAAKVATRRQEDRVNDRVELVAGPQHTAQVESVV